MTEKEYGKLVKEMAPKSPIWKDCLNAFWIGGLICAIGQAIMNGYLALGLDKEDAGTAMSMTLVFLSALLTGLSLMITSQNMQVREPWYPSPALPMLSLRRQWNSKPRVLF